MAFSDIVQSWGVMDLNRTDVSSFIDIVYWNAEMFFPPITSWGGGGGFSVLSSPIIKAIKIWR